MSNSTATGRDRQRPRRRLSTAVRLAALHALVFAVVLGVVTVALVSSFSTSYESVAASSLGAELRQFASTAAQRPVGQSLETFSYRYLQTHALASGDAVLVALKKGGRVETAGGLALERSPIVIAAISHPTTTSSVRPTTISGHPVELATVPIFDGRTFVGTVIASADLTPFAAERSRVLALSFAEAAIALVAGAASSYILLRQLLRTVGRITVTADELGRSSLDKRLGDQGSDDEVGDLARTFDEMLDRIESALKGQRRLLADVSHQLRTPLTVARGHLEVLGLTGTKDPEAVKETIGLVVDEIAHMGAVVERLLMLGHAMDPDFLETHPVDLRALVGDCFAAAQALEPRNYSLGPVPDIVVAIDDAKVRGAILNLVANAVRATTVDDEIRLSVLINVVHQEIEIIVEDSGPGIPVHARELALERFARPGARNTEGSGLGLAIVRAVAEAHGGRVFIDQSTLGGARVTMMFPTSLVIDSEGSADEDSRG